MSLWAPTRTFILAWLRRNLQVETYYDKQSKVLAFVNTFEPDHLSFGTR